MAKPVDFRPVPRPATEELQRKLDAAPLEHADAVLNAYRVLQMLHDTDTLDMVRGLLGAGDTVLNEAVSVMTSPASVRAIRNLLLLVNLLGEVDPEVLHALSDALAPLIKPAADRPKAPSIFSLAGKVFSRDVRLVLGIGLIAAGSIGQSLRKRQN
ncbi:MAG TPA: hypothetical protein VGD62_13945 [Acidobacteriaceae bacterium]